MNIKHVRKNTQIILIELWGKKPCVYYSLQVGKTRKRGLYVNLCRKFLHYK